MFAIDGGSMERVENHDIGSQKKNNPRTSLKEER